jgi:ATP-binding cassette, subfamily C, bacterial CydC
VNSAATSRSRVPAESAAPHKPTAQAQLWRLAAAGPARWRLLLAALTGAAATGSGVALLAVSGFLLARASEHPSIVEIFVAVVAVRVLGISRAVFHYVERLLSRNAALRPLAGFRPTIYRRGERLAPAGQLTLNYPDQRARLTGDVDGAPDLLVGGLAPLLAAAVVGGSAVAVITALLVPAGLLLSAGLLIGGIAVPLIVVRNARAAARRSAPARDLLAVTVTDLLAGAADAHTCALEDQLLARALAADAAATRLARRTALTSGLGVALTTAAGAATLCGVLLVGVAATGSGALTKVPLAVVTLTALAAFEAVTAVPAAALELRQAGAAADRIADIVSIAPEPVTEAALRVPVPPGASTG